MNNENKMSNKIVLDKFQLIISLKNCCILQINGKVLVTSTTGNGKYVMMAWVL